MTLQDLPMLNACLNSLSTLFLLLGYFFIRQKKELAHRKMMLSAFTTSTLFLISYLFYHYMAGRTTFVEPAWFRKYYLALLLSHTVLAVVIVPMILTSIVYGLRGRREAHRKIARWTWPLWMYVSVTGVLVYLILYQIFPQK